jgi:hypothetical protein
MIFRNLLLSSDSSSLNDVAFISLQRAGSFICILQASDDRANDDVNNASHPVPNTQLSWEMPEMLAVQRSDWF